MTSSNGLSLPPCGGQHELSEIDASVPFLTPPCGGHGADRGAKSEACLPYHWPRAAMFGGLAPNNPISEEG